MLLLILLIGLSHIYLGAHFLSDVLAGYLSGGVWLLALLSGAGILETVRGQGSGARGQGSGISQQR